MAKELIQQHSLPGSKSVLQIHSLHTNPTLSTQRNKKEIAKKVYENQKNTLKWEKIQANLNITV